jgi:hypothetical protein
MAFQERIDDHIEEAETDESTPSTSDSTTPPPADPFSMEFDLEQFEVDAQTADQMLGVLVAVTNLV